MASVGLLALLHAVLAVAQVPPAEARARLEAFVGSWTVLGQEETYSETCEWYHNNSFIVCNTEERQPKGVSKSVSILGFSELAGSYTYYGFGSSGGSRSLNGFRKGNEWVFTGERAARGDLVRYQVSMKPTTSGFTFLEERSTNGGPWVVAAQFEYVRRK